MNTRKWRRPDYLEITADLVMDAIGKARSAGVPLYMIREGINWLCSEIDWYNDDQTVPPTPERLRVVHPPGTQLRLPLEPEEPLAKRPEPPRLEPGPRPTLSNAVDPPAVKTARRASS